MRGNLDPCEHSASRPRQTGTSEKSSPVLFPFGKSSQESPGNENGRGSIWTSAVLNEIRPLSSIFSNDLAIDLGTVNTRIYSRGQGIVINEPSAVAVNTVTRKLEAMGKEAWEMAGRTPSHIAVIRPLKNGVIADFRLAQAMLDYFIRKAHNRTTLVHPRIVISVPSEITQVERRAVMESAYRARASEVHLVEQAMMAAIGAGLPVSKPRGNLIVDIGGGTTDIAVISCNGIVYARSLRIAGNHMDEAIADYVRQKHNLLIGERTAEKIKIEIGSAFPLEEPLRIEAKGRDLVANLPNWLTLNDSEIRGALDECVTGIAIGIRAALERTPPELASDIGDSGIVLAGGGALLRNLDARIREETGLPVTVADDPIGSVVLGAGRMLEDFSLLHRVEVA
jgi:rod shape-determining protein MreB